MSSDAAPSRRLLLATAAVVAVQLGAAAWGVAAQDGVGLLVALGGSVPLLGVAVAASLGGRVPRSLLHRVVLGGTPGAATAYVLALGAATWSFLAGHTLPALVSAAVGGVAYAAAGARPGQRAGSVPSTAVVAVLVLLAAAGGVALVAGA